MGYTLYNIIMLSLILCRVTTDDSAKPETVEESPQPPKDSETNVEDKTEEAKPEEAKPEEAKKDEDKTEDTQESVTDET